MSMLTGGSSTGQLIALPQIAPKLTALGLNVNIIHRVSCFAATTLDSMPYCGSILMLLPMSHMKLKEAYPPLFVTTVICTTIGTITVMIMCTLFPGLA
jgi:H+/gluconate symporter-like permease